MKTKHGLLLVLLFIFLQSVSSQEIKDTTLVRIITNDGNDYLGNVLNETENAIQINTQILGQITIQKKDIKSRETVNNEQIKDGKLWFDNPQSTRYFWSPNGYGLKKGEGYYHNIWVLWNQFAYGITDNISLGGGVIPLFLFGGGPTPVFFTPKVSIPIKKDQFNIGAGAIVGTILGESETGFGIVYGLTTFGSPNNNVSLGVGYGFAGGDWAKSPMINFGGMFRLTNRGYIITENYFLHAEDVNIVLLSVGGRWIIKKAALDFGLGIPVSSDMDVFIAAPWLGFTIPFGKK